MRPTQQGAGRDGETLVSPLLGDHVGQQLGGSFDVEVMVTRATGAEGKC